MGLKDQIVIPNTWQIREEVEDGSELEDFLTWWVWKAEKVKRVKKVWVDSDAGKENTRDGVIYRCVYVVLLPEMNSIFHYMFCTT